MKALGYLNKFFWTYKLRFFSGLLFICLSTYFITSSVDLLGNGLDFAKFASDHHLQRDATVHILLMYGLEIILYTLAYGFFLFLNRQTIIVMSRLIEYDMKNEVFNQYQKLDQKFYKTNNTGDLMNRISEDVGRVRMYVGPAVMYTTTTLITLVMTIYFMFKTDIVFTLYVLSPLPLLAWSIYVVSNRINKKSLKVQEQLSMLSTSSQETFSGIRVVKAFTREEQIQDRFVGESDEYMKRNLSLAKTESLFQPFMMLLIGMSILITIFIGGTKAINGEITIGVITSFVLFVMRLTWPIASLGWVTSLIQRAAASQERINEFLHIEPEIKNPTTEALNLRGKIEFNNVTFTYPDSGVTALNGLSFTAEPGSSIAFIGRTGSGKSTIAHLMVRLFDVSNGEIKIDNKPVKKVNLDELRDRTGYVPQEVFLFSESIAGNIGFSAHDLAEIDSNRSAIEQAAKDAAVYANIMEFPDKFDTLVGERGVTLSGGQQQRISIARAILKQPQILIFDDCLSAVDTETEDEILSNLRRIMSGKTTVIISHRVSSVRYADQIIVLDEGKALESGTHASLLEKNGIYRELYKKQVEDLKEN
ncbi:MAG: ABC transporter ATP-binding protein/permease [Bacteroidota bacterium]|nr:ABC transporter ATP-binding protein/permease [Bacteroidota bacterium]